MYTLELNTSEMIRLLFTLESSVNKARKACRETDATYGNLNNMYREQISDMKGIHAQIVQKLQANNLMVNVILDDPIDERLPEACTD